MSSVGAWRPILETVLPLEEYEVRERLRFAERSQVYAATRKADGRRVIIKIYPRDRAIDDRAQAQHEFDALRKLSTPGIPEALGVLRSGERPALVIEQVPGLNLKEILAKGPLAIETFLSIAQQLVQILGQIHAARVVHRDINPSNILFDSASGRAFIIDFGVAIELGHTSDPSWEVGVGTLRYMAPEQTGRMNRGVELRSDLYSLGATFFELLTGRVPFESDDALELIHAQIARVPESAQSLNAAVPPTLSRIVAKLLEKSPDRRYQSCAGLGHDLDLCAQQWRASGQIQADLELGTADALHRLQFPDALYGRDAELGRLARALEGACAGQPRLLLVHGAPGTGKSALAAQLQTRAIERSAYYAQGSFEGSLDEHSVLAFRRAFESLAEQLLTESSDRVEHWSEQLQQALGPLQRAITDLVPSLAPLLPAPEPLPPVGPEQSLHRLVSACDRFVRVFASENHPLVLVLDDCQSADRGSLQLIELLLQPTAGTHLLLVLTLPEPTEDVSALRERLSAQGCAQADLQLAPLPLEATHAWLSAVLRREPEESIELARRMDRTTGGNPFLMRQYVIRLFELGVLRPGAASSGWSWDPSALDGLELPDDVATILTEKITELPDTQRRVLELASCLGDALDVRSLVELARIDEGSVQVAVASLCEAGLLNASSGGLSFAHRRLRAAARDLLDADERARLHETIGTRMLEETPAEALPDRVSQVMTHLNQAPVPADDAQRWRRIELNLMAAGRALAGGNPRAATEYLRHGRGSFRPGDWNERGAVGFQLYFQSAEAAYAEGRSDDALDLLSGLERLPLDELQLALLHGRRSGIRVITQGLELGVLDALAGLRKLGSRWSGAYSYRTLVWSTLRGAWHLMWMNEEKLRGPSRIPDANSMAKSIIFLHIGLATYRYSSSLFAQIIAESLYFRRVRGLASDASLPLVGFSHTQALLTGNFDWTDRLGALARRVAGPTPERRFRATFLMAEQLTVAPWVKHRRTTLGPIAEAERIAEELGEIEQSIYAGWNAAVVLYLVGEPLVAVIERLEGVARRYRHATSGRNSTGPLVQGLMHLRKDKPLDEAEMIRACQEIDGAIDPVCMTVWIGVMVVRGDYELALRTSDRLVKTISRRLATLPHVPEFWFVRGLAATALMRAATPFRRRSLRREARRCLRKMQHFARYGPENFEHQATLLEAELAATAGRAERAMTLYRRATELAQRHSYHPHAAIALQRRAELCLEQRLPHEAAHDLTRALALFQNWQADTVVGRIRRDHLELLQDYGPALAQFHGTAEEATITTGRLTRGLETTGTISPMDESALNMTALLRASEALSGELQLNRVLDRVMRIAIEMAGAQRTVLLLQSSEGLRIAAEHSVQGQTLVHPNRPSLSSAADRVPTSLIQYVERSRKTLVLGNAAREGLFRDDAYVREHASTSILCLPILRQTRLVGLLYLENDLAPDAFTPGSVDVLGLLSTHAAISLDNARLYDELRDLNAGLERRVDLRTEELRSARDEARAADRAKSEFLAVMSHEIRTPMNVVIGMTQILEEMQLSSDQHECVHAVRTASSSLLTLINDILDFSKIEAGKLELEAIPFNVRECIEEVVEILAPRAGERGLELPVFMDRSLPESILGDPVRLKQVITNFMSNALKFTETGEVSIEMRPAPENPDWLRLEVRDTGIGIPEDRLHKLFQKFSQVDVSTTRRYGGTGLGLAISRGLIEEMGGRVGVESRSGEGTTFWFEIPIEHAAQATSRLALPLEPLRIAVLMSHRNSAAGIAERIRFLGGEAHVCTELDEAREALQGAAHPVLLLRDPLERAGWEAWTAQLERERPGSVLLMRTLQRRTDPGEGLGATALRTLTWPVRDRGLRQVLGACLGLEAPEASRPASVEEPAPSEALGREARIIVAEDYPLNQKLIQRLLKRFGYDCDIVENGELLLEITAAEPYDLALVDCQMPIVDGLEATRRIRAREAAGGGHLPIIAMTANAMKGDREQCLESGMDDYLSKPLHMDALERVLGKYLGGEKADAPV